MDSSLYMGQSLETKISYGERKEKGLVLSCVVRMSLRLDAAVALLRHDYGYDHVLDFRLRCLEINVKLFLR